MRKKLLTTISVLSIGLLMSGCSLLDTSTPRGSDGRVTESATISARDLLTGDCFTFNSADGGIVEQVTVMPCSEDHDYIIIGQGNLPWRDVTTAGSLQNAVSAACAPEFDAFKAAILGTTRPKQEFMVFPESDTPNSDQLYSCMSTDPDQNFIPPTPEPTPTPAA